MSTNPLRAGVLALAWLLLAAPAGSTTIANLSISNGSTSFFDDAGVTGSVGQSSTSVLANGAAGFDLRYAAVIGADTGGNGADQGTFTQNFSGSFTITFEVTQTAGWTWTVNVDVLRAGAMTIINDSAGSANVTLDALTVVHSGAGVLGGSLGLAAVGTLSSTASIDQPFSQSSAAAITGTGTGSAQLVSLAFAFTGSATTVAVNPPGPFTPWQGDEAALRMGVDSALTSFTADDYPGVPARLLANDGILVSAAVPEPAAEALLALGLIGLAWFERQRRP